MRIEFDFTNGTLPFSATVDQIVPRPVELCVQETGTPNQRTESLYLYIEALLNLFRGVSNIATAKIGRVMVEKAWFGRLESRLYSLDWDSRIEKYFFVVYDLQKASLAEDMYVADGISRSKSKGGKTNIEPVWLTSLLSSKSKSSRTEIEHLRDTIAVVTEHIEGYNLAFRNGKLTLQSKETGKSLEIDDIKEDDIYVLVRLVYQILQKGLHQGVFFINGRFYSDEVLKAISDISRFIYGYSFIFLYNLRKGCTVERDTVVLPNFRQNG